MKVGLELNTLAQTAFEDMGAAITSSGAGKNIKMDYNKVLEKLFGQSNQDYVVLTHKADKSVNKSKNISKTFAEGLKSFFEKGCMF